MYAYFWNKLHLFGNSLGKRTEAISCIVRMSLPFHSIEAGAPMLCRRSAFHLRAMEAAYHCWFTFWFAALQCAISTFEARGISDSLPFLPRMTKKWCSFFSFVASMSADVSAYI